MNSGEANELKLKIMLVYLRDNKTDNLGPFKSISSVGFKDKTGQYYEYFSPPVQFKIQNLADLTDIELQDLANTMNISKSSTANKSDVYINGKGYSVKSFEGANPALVNHTIRPGFETACTYNDVDITILDNLIDQYWALRKNSVIGEDIKNSNSNSPFSNYKEYFRPILNYFLFDGTGRGVSKLPADYILDFNSPLNPSTWKIHNRQNALDVVWDRLVFSVRSKKGMESYLKLIGKEKNGNTLTKDEKIKKESAEKWIEFIQNHYRGALHIRAEKQKK